MEPLLLVGTSIIIIPRRYSFTAPVVGSGGLAGVTIGQVDLGEVDGLAVARVAPSLSIWPSGLRRRVKAAVFWAGVRIPLWTLFFFTSKGGMGRGFIYGPVGGV